MVSAMHSFSVTIKQITIVRQYKNQIIIIQRMKSEVMMPAYNPSTSEGVAGELGIQRKGGKSYVSFNITYVILFNSPSISRISYLDIR